MQEVNTEKKILEVDFRKLRRIKKGLPFIGFRCGGVLKPLSGEWAFKDSQLQTRYQGNKSNSKESIMLFGARHWNDYTLKVHFCFLSESLDPEEGGIILYFRYKNQRNHYSFHFCVSKKRVELWKRLRGKWSLVSESVPYSFRLNHPYSVTIRCNGSTHSCFVDEEPILCCEDIDIPKGSIGLGAKFCSVGFENLLVNAIV